MRLYGTLAELSSLTIRLASGKTVQVAAAEPTASAVVVTIPDVADGSDTFVMVDTTQTLTNKTLSSPVLTIANIEATRLVIPKLSDPAITRDQGSLILDSDTNLVTVGEGGGTAYKVLVDETTAQTLQNKTLSTPTISGGAITGSVLGSDLNPVTITHADKIALGKITDVSANHVLISDANNEVYSEAQLSKSRGGTGADLSDVVFPANVPSTIQTDIAELTSLKVDRAAPVITGGILAPSASKEVIQRIATAANFNEISSPEDGRYFILMNASGSDITIGNETGTAANQIVTGTGAAFTFKNGTSLAAVYDGGSSKWRLSGGAGGAGGGTADVISQVAHGFSVGQAVWIDPLDGAYKKAQADAANTAEVVGVVSKVVSVDAFELTLSGEISGLTGLEPGEVYFLSAATAGALTKVEPSVVGQVSLPVGVASSATSLYVLPKRGVVVGGANLRTQIGLNGAAFVNQTTNIQNVTAYTAGELSGWVYIDATTDRRFYIQVQFVKDAANAWKVAYQTTGDTPPAGFNVDVIISGPDAFVQVQMPPVAGWVSGNVNFALNVPAVGATLPLQVDSANVSFADIKAASSAGITFKEDGNTTVGSVSDAGAWTLGGAAFAGTHNLNGALSLINAVATGAKLSTYSNNALANGATVTIASGALGGFVLVRVAAPGTERFTIFSAHAGGNSTAQLVTGGLGAGTTAVLNAANVVNFAASGGNYVLQNNAGGTVSVHLLIVAMGG